MALLTHYATTNFAVTSNTTEDEEAILRIVEPATGIVSGRIFVRTGSDVDDLFRIAKEMADKKQQFMDSPAITPEPNWNNGKSAIATLPTV